MSLFFSISACNLEPSVQGVGFVVQTVKNVVGFYYFVYGGNDIVGRFIDADYFSRKGFVWGGGGRGGGVGGCVKI